MDPFEQLLRTVGAAFAQEFLRGILGVPPIGPAASGRRDRRRPPRAEPRGDPGDPYGMLGVTRQAPRVVVEAAYRALVKARHPDVGGSEERMKAVNGAMEAIRRQRRWS